MSSIEDLMLRLVAVQSDSGTALECDAARAIHDMIRAEPYFAANPELYGLYHSDDFLGRPVVWALRRGAGRKTIILLGHYDAVEIDSYGPLKPYALDPAGLKRRMKSVGGFSESLMGDLDDDDWLFGRGAADMKAGLAINLHTLFNNANPEVQILFVAVADEENLSAGARSTISLLQQLRERFHLDYRLALISEPQFRSEQDDIQLIEGSMGKILPLIVAKGVLAHAAEVFKGLNSGLIIAEIIRNVELAMAFVSEDHGVGSQPPTVLFFRDLKETYDVSLPEYSVAGFNIPYLNSTTPLELIAALKTICRQALERVVRRYAEAYADMARRGFVTGTDCKSFRPRVFTLAELEAFLQEFLPDFDSYRRALNTRLEDQVRNHGMTLQSASSIYLKSLLEVSRVTDPAVVIGIAPPYYPAVRNDLIGKDIEYCFKGIAAEMGAETGRGIRRWPSFCAMTDMSYLSCRDPDGEREFLRNLTLPPSLYDIPVEAIAELNIPALLVGPEGRDVHQIGERVYMPDVTGTIPALFKMIINRL